MPKVCIVPFCKNTDSQPGVRSFRVTENRRQPWLRALGRNENDQVSKNNVVCSDHFSNEAFLNDGSLKIDAVPTRLLRPKGPVLISRGAALNLLFVEEGKSPSCATQVSVKEERENVPISDMMPYCAISTCKVSKGGTYRFPAPSKNMPLFLKWVKICANKQLSEKHMTPERIYDSYRVCYRHFSNADFNKRNQFLDNVVPHLYIPANNKENVLVQPTPSRQEKPNENLRLGKMVWVTCRTCLERTDPNFSPRIQGECFLGKSFKEVIHLFIPQMATAVGGDEVICLKCSEFLKIFAKFFNKCMAVEEIFKKAKEQNKGMLGHHKVNGAENNKDKANSNILKTKSRTTTDKDVIDLTSDLPDTQQRVPPVQTPLDVNKLPQTYLFHQNGLFYLIRPTILPQTQEMAVQPTQNTTDKVMGDACHTSLPTGDHNKTTTKTKYSLNNKKDIVPCKTDTSNSSTDSCEENSIPTFEYCEVKVENNDIITNGKIKKVDQRLTTIEEGSLHQFPIKDHDRVISVAQTDEILAGAIKSNIAVYQYGTTKEEVVNKRILFFGSAVGQCPKCKIVLKNGRTLENHVRLCTGNERKHTETIEKPLKLHPCPICKLSVHSEWLLTKHLLRVHKDYKPHKCEKCGKCFKSKAGLTNHNKMFKKFPNCDGRRCYLCSEMVSQEDYYNHTKSHPRSIVCEECGLAFAKPHHLELHRKKHEFKRDIKQLCPICGKMARYLSIHLQTHQTGDKKYMCHKCPKFFMTETRVARHIRRVHLENKLQCSKCNKKFSSTCYLKNHYKLKHSNTYPHMCELCGKKFARIDYLKRHINNHAGGWTDRPRKYRYAGDKLPGPAMCKYCPKQFKTVYRLRTHLISSHVKSMRYKCKFCTRSFSSYANRYRHEQIHKRHNFELSCDICWKKVESKEELENHMIKHEHSKKYKCEFCDLSFARQYLLSHHISESHISVEEVEKERENVLTDALEEFLL